MGFGSKGILGARGMAGLAWAGLSAAPPGRPVRLKVSAYAIRTVERKGGLDAFLLDARDSELTTEIRRLKRRIKKAQSKTAA